MLKNNFVSQNLDTSNKKKKNDDDDDEDLDEKLKKMGTSVMDVGCTLHFGMLQYSFTFYNIFALISASALRTQSEHNLRESCRGSWEAKEEGETHQLAWQVDREIPSCLNSWWIGWDV